MACVASGDKQVSQDLGDLFDQAIFLPLGEVKTDDPFHWLASRQLGTDLGGQVGRGDAGRLLANGAGLDQSLDQDALLALECALGCLRLVDEAVQRGRGASASSSLLFGLLTLGCFLDGFGSLNDWLANFT